MPCREAVGSWGASVEKYGHHATLGMGFRRIRETRYILGAGVRGDGGQERRSSGRDHGQQ